MDSDSRAIMGGTFGMVLIVFFYCVFNGAYITYIKGEQDKIKVEMRVRKECQQEQGEESTIICPRCMKEFELNEQPPEYKKQPRRTPAPCGTVK